MVGAWVACGTLVVGAAAAERRRYPDSGYRVRLPNVDRALIDEAKLREYLLSDAHQVGRFKATFFRALGFTLDQWQELRDAILDLAAHEVAEPTEITAFGSKYRVVGLLAGPTGRQATVVTIWIVLHGEELPRFITAYPG